MVDKKLTFFAADGGKEVKSDIDENRSQRAVKQSTLFKCYKQVYCASELTRTRIISAIWLNKPPTKHASQA